MERRRWANFLISMVKYDHQKTLIEEVEVQEDLGYGISQTNDFIIRQKLIENIEKKLTYMTIIFDKKGMWRMGQKVEIKEVNSQKFLKTTNDDTPKDDLGELREY